MNPTIKGVLTFCGGTGSVTGANFLLEVAGKKILVDCGLEQGTEFAEEVNREAFPYDPAVIDFLLITHAHADHIGKIGKLVKDGFKGIIYSTPATLDLSKVMLADAVRILEEEAKKKGGLPLYGAKDVAQSFTLWKTVNYYTPLDLGGPQVVLKDSGHILGAAMFEISVPGSTKKIVFTGDLGNSPALFLRDTDKITDATYMVMESVYGDRNHESKEERTAKFVKIVKGVIDGKRTLIIPVFSLERTQDILFELHSMISNNEIQPLPVYLDSPLAVHVTEIYKRYTGDFKPEAQKILSQTNHIFDFPKLEPTLKRWQSEKIDDSSSPKIILAGSGMSAGGRILHHEQHFLPDPNTTLLLVGYQALGTIGRQLQDGTKEIMIDDVKVQVKAQIQTIFGYSSHKDSDHLVEFVADSEKTLKQVFVTMGEPKAALFLVQRLRDYAGVNATAPKKGDRVELEF